MRYQVENFIIPTIFHIACFRLRDYLGLLEFLFNILERQVLQKVLFIV